VVLRAEIQHDEPEAPGAHERVRGARGQTNFGYPDDGKSFEIDATCSSIRWKETALTPSDPADGLASQLRLEHESEGEAQDRTGGTTRELGQTPLQGFKRPGRDCFCWEAVR
jgi:hypothetical protein